MRPLGRQGGVLLMKLVPRENRQQSSAPFTTTSARSEFSHNLSTRTGLRQDKESASTLIRNSSLQNWEDKCLLFKPWILEIVLRHSERFAHSSSAHGANLPSHQQLNLTRRLSTKVLRAPVLPARKINTAAFPYGGALLMACPRWIDCWAYSSSSFPDFFLIYN